MARPRFLPWVYSDKRWAKLGGLLLLERQTAPVLPALADHPRPLAGRDLRALALAAAVRLLDLPDLCTATAVRRRALPDLRLEAAARRLVPDLRAPLSAVAAPPGFPLAGPTPAPVAALGRRAGLAGHQRQGLTGRRQPALVERPTI